MDTGSKSPKNVEQQRERPHGPMPPNNLALSRTPICLNSILVLNFVLIL